ncbi:hypothetical protein PVNG_02512 [Plasmodium vivax North Korean]|uniref:Phosphatase n=1 Tax=Plasmodium vivax North Korean TaxID=1035514 RepID=A0A0J9WEQ3_PLAVI|nr:hypothetical protein PVNG_02512 [Plasmodium vivax North Korean]
MAAATGRAAEQASRTPRLKRALCVKYLTFLSHIKRINVKRPWNRHYCCVFRTEGPEVVTMRGLIGSIVAPHRGRHPRNKDSLLSTLLSHMLSKPVRIASLDLDGTLINPTGEKHPNSILINSEAMQSIIAITKMRQYQVVIFSNQTSVSSPVCDAAHVERNKLPPLFTKVRRLTDALRYFYALCGGHIGGRNKLGRKDKLGRRLHAGGNPPIERPHGRAPPRDTPNGTTHRSNCGVSAFFAVGKGNIEALDPYPKPSEGQYCLFICLEGIKYALMLMSYFAKESRTLLEGELIMQKGKPLGEFLRLVVDMCEIPFLHTLVKRLRRGPFHLNKVRLLVLDVYLNALLRKMEFYVRFGREHPGYAAHVQFFLSDAGWGGSLGGAGEGGHADRSDLAGVPPPPELLRDELFLAHLVRCLACKNEVMKRLATTFSRALFNSEQSFYAGDNVGRDFDHSDVDLQHNHNPLAF